jgi:hypothetical protein
MKRRQREDKMPEKERNKESEIKYSWRTEGSDIDVVIRMLNFSVLYPQGPGIYSTIKQ